MTVFELHDASFSGIGDRQDTVMWGTLKIHLSAGNDEYPAVEIDVRVPNRPDVTLSEMESAARADALAILKAATAYLEKHEISELLIVGKVHEPMKDIIFK
jgi:hypothetical protein